jgi:hypothetical protein
MCFGHPSFFVLPRLSEMTMLSQKNSIRSCFTQTLGHPTTLTSSPQSRQGRTPLPYDEDPHDFSDRTSNWWPASANPSHPDLRPPSTWSGVSIRAFRNGNWKTEKKKKNDLAVHAAVTPRHPPRSEDRRGRGGARLRCPGTRFMITGQVPMIDHCPRPDCEAT